MKKLLFIPSLLVTLIITASTALAAQCGKTQTSFDYGCSGKGTAAQQIILAVVNFLAIGVGIAVVGGIVFGAIRYITSNGNAAQAQQGVSVIVNAVIGLLLFIFMYAIINFLIPGGLFN